MGSELVAIQHNSGPLQKYLLIRSIEYRSRTTADTKKLSISAYLSDLRVMLASSWSACDQEVLALFENRLESST
jgi:hypothetical protein